MAHFDVIKFVYSFLSILEESINLKVKEWTLKDLEKALKYSNYCEKMYRTVNQEHVSNIEKNSLDENIKKLNALPWSLGNVEISFEFLSKSSNHLIQNLLRNPHLPDKLFYQILSYESNEICSQVILDITNPTKSHVKQQTKEDGIYDERLDQDENAGNVESCKMNTKRLKVELGKDDYGEESDEEDEEDDGIGSLTKQELKIERMTMALAKYLKLTLQNSSTDIVTVNELTSKLNTLMNKDGARILLKCIFAAISINVLMENVSVKFLIDYFIKILPEQFMILAEFPVECRHLCDQNKSIAGRFMEFIKQFKRDKSNKVILQLIEEFAENGSPNITKTIINLL